MKRLLAPLLLVLTTFTFSLGQSDSDVYVWLHYVEATTDDIVNIETELWQPVWQEMAQQGHRVAWTFFEVWNSFDNSYTHVYAHAADDLDDMAFDQEAFGNAFSVAHPGKNLDSLMANSTSHFKNVKNELWRVRATAGDPWHGDFMTVGYMKVPPGGNAEYVSVERDIWKPLMSVRSDDGAIKGWGIMAKWYPGGTEYPYTHVAVNSFSALGDLADASTTEDQVARAHPDGNWDEMIERTGKSREMVRTELWRQVRHVHAQ